MNSTDQPDLLRAAKARPRLGRLATDRLSILLEEMRLATSWSRPGILLAVHRCRQAQLPAVQALQHQLHDIQIPVLHFWPETDPGGLLPRILGQHANGEAVYFLHGLGSQLATYQELNLHRETIVEQRLRLLFWLTDYELTLLAQRAPDFWAFRHRVVQFPLSRTGRPVQLPAGALLWHTSRPVSAPDSLGERIEAERALYNALGSETEMVAARAQVAGTLAWLLWLQGERGMAEDLLQRELSGLRFLGLPAVEAVLLNALAVSCYDRGSYREALEWSESALKANPADALLWANHGVVCRAARMARRSSGSLRRAIRLDPEIADHWLILAYVQMAMQKFEPALKALGRAAQLRKNDHTLQLAQAVCFAQLGDSVRLAAVVQQLASLQDLDPILAGCLHAFAPAGEGSAQTLRELVSTPGPIALALARSPLLFFIFSSAGLGRPAEVAA